MTEIARALGEKIALKKTQYRLSRQLGRDDLGRRVLNGLCRMGARRVEKTSLGPLYGSLYSQQSPDFLSENLEIRQAIRKVSQATEKKGIWVLDRGGDREDIFHFLLQNQLSFIVRLKGTRNLISRGGEYSVLELAMSCPLPYAERIVKQEKGKETIYELQFGARSVSLPGRKEPLTLVIIRGFGEEPLMLLTDLRVSRSRKSLWGILESYLTRWRIEETIRFLKQSYQLEDIRLLTYHRLQNMMAIVTAVAYFAMVYLGLRTKLRVLARHVIGAARRLFGIPDFHFYALADGIREYLFGHQNGLQRFYYHWLEENAQLSLFGP